MTISPEMIGAYVDGELNEADRILVEQALTTDAALQEEVARQHRLRDRLGAHFALSPADDVPDRFRDLLGFGSEPAALETGNEPPHTDNIVSFAQAKEKRGASRFWPLASGGAWGNAAAIAATLLIGVALGQFGLGGGRRGIVATHDGTLVAHGELATALDTQLASSQPIDAPVRIGVSFRDQGDNLCRTFDSGAMQGIACHDGDGWALTNTAASSRSNGSAQYRQASSADPIVMQAAQAMMKGDVLDAKAERAALADPHRR
ncbi:MAG: anti-sigma factor [Sphingobium sp.]